MYICDRESRSPEPLAFEILHQERANKVFGKRSRDCSSSTPRLVFPPSPAARSTVGFAVGFSDNSPITPWPLHRPRSVHLHRLSTYLVNYFDLLSYLV